MTIILNLYDDPEIQSGIRIRNMNFLKYVIEGELFVIATCNRYQTVPYTIPRQVEWRYRFHHQIMYPDSGSGTWISLNLP